MSDGLCDRMKKRQKVAEDPVWKNEFVPRFLEKSLKLTNTLVALTGGTSLVTDFGPCPSGPGTQTFLVIMLRLDSREKRQSLKWSVTGSLTLQLDERGRNFTIAIFLDTNAIDAVHVEHCMMHGYLLSGRAAKAR